MWWAALLGCTSTGTLVDERQRPFGAITLGAGTWSFVADLRQWRYSAGMGDEGFTTGHESTFVSYRITTPSGRVRGDADHTWAFDALADATVRHEALSLTSCTAADRAAFRVGDGPWNWLVAVGPGGAVAMLERDASSCEEALQAYPSAEAWLTDAAAQRDVCAHLTHLRRRTDALRCHLRQSADTRASPASRVELPNAANDPGFDDDLTTVLVDTPPGAAGFAPYRVLSLWPELSLDQQATVLSALRARERPRLPWEVVLLASAEPGGVEALGLRPGTVEARLAAAVAGLPQTHPFWGAATAPAGWSPPDLSTPPCAATVRLHPDACP